MRLLKLKRWHSLCNYLLKIVIIITTKPKPQIRSLKNILLILLLLTTFTGFSQEARTIRILGKVVDGQTHESIPGVNIYTKQYGTVSDIDGNFSFNLNLQDTITFSFVGYETYHFSVTDSIQTEEIEVKISLTSSLKELEEVTVHSFMTEQNFKDAVIAYNLPKEKKVKQMAGFYYGPVKPVNAKAFTSPISFLVSKFGKQAKQERHFIKQKEIFEQQKYLSSKYNKDIVANITGLNGDELDDFMHFCTLSDSVIEQATEYDMTLVINKCLKDFNEQL